MDSRSQRFGLADLIVVVVVGLVLLGFGSALSTRSAEQGYRVKCASNLRQIGLAIQMYANDNKGEFPRTIFGADDPDPAPLAYTGSASAKAFAEGGPAANDVTAALFLVLKTEDLTSEVVICPSDTRADRVGGDIQKMSNWPGRHTLSYSYQNPYPSKVARDAGFTLAFTLSSDFAIAADMNPGGALLPQLTYQSSRQQMMLGNSNNHAGDGQNVLYADGHAEFQTSPFAGMLRPSAANPTFRDNIYTAGGPNPRNAAGPMPVVLAAAQDELDSILLPTAPEGPGARPLVGNSTRALLTGGIVVVLGVLIAIVVLIARRPGGTPNA